MPPRRSRWPLIARLIMFYFLLLLFSLFTYTYMVQLGLLSSEQGLVLLPSLWAVGTLFYFGWIHRARPRGGPVKKWWIGLDKRVERDEVAMAGVVHHLNDGTKEDKERADR